MVLDNVYRDDKGNGGDSGSRKRHSRKPDPHCITRVPQNVEQIEEVDSADPLSELTSKECGINNGSPVVLDDQNIKEESLLNRDVCQDPLKLDARYEDKKIHGDDHDLTSEFDDGEVDGGHKDGAKAPLNLNMTLRDMLEAAGTPAGKDTFFSKLQNQQFTKSKDVRSNGVTKESLTKEVDSDCSFEDDSNLQIDEETNDKRSPSIGKDDGHSVSEDDDKEPEADLSSQVCVKQELLDLTDDTSSNTSSKAASITIVRSVPRGSDVLSKFSTPTPTSSAISSSPLLAASLSKPTQSPFSSLSISVVPTYKGIPYSKRPLDYDEDHGLPSSVSAKRMRPDDLCSGSEAMLGLSPVDYSSLTIEDLPNTMEDVEKQMQVLRKELKNLDNLAKEKEREWNHVIDIKKQKELLYMKCRRKKDVLVIQSRNDIQQAEEMKKYPDPFSGDITDPFQPKGTKSSPIVVSPQTQVTPPHHSVMYTIPVVSQHALGQVTISNPMILTSSDSVKPQEVINHLKPLSIGHLGSQIDVQALIKKHKTQEIQPGSLTGSTRPTLTKPTTAQAVSLQDSIVRNLLFPHADKPTVNVQSLIAEHRAKNPEVSDTPRSRYRRRWRPPHSDEGSSQPATGQGSPDSRDSEDVECIGIRAKNDSKDGSQDGGCSSRSSTPRSGIQPPSRLSLNDPNVSYKDVLVQLSKYHEESSGKPSSGSKLMSILQGFQPPSSEPQENTWQSQFSLAKLLTGSKAGEESSASSIPSLSSLLESVKSTEPRGSGRSETQLNQLFADNIKRMFAEEQEKGKQDTSKSCKSDPKCSACQKKTAEFVCTGCHKQFYCSRECQVVDWETHSEECFGVS